MNNTVIEVLNKEHGQEVKKYWKSKRFDTSRFNFSFNEEDGGSRRYYGVINNEFGNYSLKIVKAYGVEIIELPKTTEELPIPRDVLVRDSQDEKWFKRELLADLSRYNIDMPFICRNKSSGGSKTILEWRYMQELPPYITKEEAEKMLSELKGIEIKIK